MIPDIEKLLTAYLDDFNVVPRTPSNTAVPWIRLTELDAAQTDIADRLAAHYVQLECYGSKDQKTAQAEANLLARQVREHLIAIEDATHVDAVVTGVRIAGMSRIPDDAFEPARERRIITAEIWAHEA